jgi:hypothetical protein
MNADAISPIDGEAAEKFLQEYAEEVSRRQNEIDGQLTLDAEAEAVDREQRDQTDNVSDIAQAAAERAKGRPAGGAE